ncbi:MAG: DUF308 domain-containing protein, partial [Eubacterium sp.]|nr:DUF308 domain-containing protein [Eubacterium sp.]
MSVIGRILSVIIGIVFVIIGIAALACPLETFEILSWIWAILVIVGGVASIIAFFAVGPESPGRGLLMFSGIVMVILGIILLGNGPVFTTFTALVLLQIWIIFSGITN